VAVNSVHVRAYGELGVIVIIYRVDPVNLTRIRAEYWLSSLKVVTIVAFIVIGTLVNVGVNREHHYIGTRYWHIPGAPFVGGFGGFAKVFVTASFACELTRSPCATVIPAELTRVHMTSFRFRRWY